MEVVEVVNVASDLMEPRILVARTRSLEERKSECKKFILSVLELHSLY